MSTTAAPVAPEIDAAQFAAFIDAIGLAADETISLAYELQSQWNVAAGTVSDAVAVAAELPTVANCFVSPNPLRPGVRPGRRGRATDVARLAALVVDLDIKPGGCVDMATADAILVDLAVEVGDPPAAVVETGHGIHGYWRIADGHVTNGDTTGQQVLLRRWGSLVRSVAARHGAAVDSVFDLARMMRIPGSFNCKDDARRIPVVLRESGALTC